MNIMYADNSAVSIARTTEDVDTDILINKPYERIKIIYLKVYTGNEWENFAIIKIYANPDIQYIKVSEIGDALVACINTMARPHVAAREDGIEKLLGTLEIITIDDTRYVVNPIYNINKQEE